jgi:hypothetical protein
MFCTFDDFHPVLAPRTVVHTAIGINGLWRAKVALKALGGSAAALAATCCIENGEAGQGDFRLAALANSLRHLQPL